MKLKIHFDSYVMKGDSIILEGDTIEEIIDMFKQWLISRGMDEDVNKNSVWTEVISE